MLLQVALDCLQLKLLGFLAQKQKVELAQMGDDIQVTLIDDNKKGEEDGQTSK